MPEKYRVVGGPTFNFTIISTDTNFTLAFSSVVLPFWGNKQFAEN